MNRGDFSGETKEMISLSCLTSALAFALPSFMCPYSKANSLWILFRRKGVDEYGNASKVYHLITKVSWGKEKKRVKKAWLNWRQQHKKCTMKHSTDGKLENK